MPERNQMWVGLARTAVSGVIAAIAVIFFFGGREAKINDLLSWKTETAPKIQRMDTTGTLSFELFHKEYERTQQRQEEKIKELEKEIRALERAAHQPN
jgi:predicted ribosome quality control (RQC) complex YloA/Tae2 family protein